ncbi:type II secretion system major pseudopilin GspG [Chitinilyticum aquatile]|uniref:type II secretion system major pseudopilin GspG n=1 Tax=Chitinilyticum aquatile TaxID=362520 RepID=UPI000406A7EC|nr:type II secretion system major pseudopilin GspG [Chitinilyticum aquatile]
MRNRFQPLRYSQGFTLLEMLVVLVIIGMLVSLVGPKLFSHVDSSKVQTAETQVKLLRGALETMRLDIGVYPTEAQGLDLLVTKPSESKLAKKWRGPYLEDELPVDPWGNPYKYVVPGPDGRPFGITSLGSDGEPGGEGSAADIGMLPKKKAAAEE